MPIYTYSLSPAITEGYRTTPPSEDPALKRKRLRQLDALDEDLREQQRARWEAQAASQPTEEINASLLRTLRSRARELNSAAQDVAVSLRYAVLSLLAKSPTPEELKTLLKESGLPPKTVLELLERSTKKQPKTEKEKANNPFYDLARRVTPETVALLNDRYRENAAKTSKKFGKTSRVDAPEDLSVLDESFSWELDALEEEDDQKHLEDLGHGTDDQKEREEYYANRGVRAEKAAKKA